MIFKACFRRILYLVLGAMATLLTAGAGMAADFLPPEKAFALTAKALDASKLELKWQVADGYYLYRERLRVHANPTDVKTVDLDTPTAESKFDPNFNKNMEVYHHELTVKVDATQMAKAKDMVIEYQGCAKAGLCYPPQFAKVKWAPGGDGGKLGAVSVAGVEQPDAGAKDVTAPLMATTVQAPAPKPANAAKAAAKPDTADNADMIGRTLATGSLLKTAAVFWFAGLLLSFTPCVLPMVPILSTLIAGQSGVVTRRKGFMLALSYVFGMAIVYACFGIAAGLAGEGLAASLQNPWVLGAFGLMLSTLALGMFGVFELQMPAALQNKAVGWSNKFEGGSYAAVFVMGGLSALILGPCVAAPLAGALVYISQTRDVMIGGTALFFMGLGMGVPLLLVGMSAGSLLPRAGAWMEMVKHVFGIILLGTAVWIISPVIGVQIQMLLWAALLLGAAYVFGGIFPVKQPGLLRLAGVAFAALSALLLVGAASGGKSLLQPLAHLQPATRIVQAGGMEAANSPNATSHGLAFKRVSTIAELDAALAVAAQKQQATMLDFYADWCVACKEFESFTFADPAVHERIAKGQVQLLQVDVTANNAHDKALLKRFSLFGPPGIVFFKGDQPAAVSHQIVGYQNAVDFLVSLDRAQIL